MEFKKSTLLDALNFTSDTSAYRHLLNCGADPQATDESLDNLKLPRLMKIRSSNSTHAALVINRDDVSIVEYRSRRDEPDNCYLHCKVCYGPMSLFAGNFAHYYTREFTEAALAKIQAAFDAGEKEIDIPKDGLYEPFKEYYNGKIVNSWEVPRHTQKAKELSLFDEF